MNLIAQFNAPTNSEGVLKSICMGNHGFREDYQESWEPGEGVSMPNLS